MTTAALRARFVVTVLLATIITPGRLVGAQAGGGLRDQPIPRDLVEALVGGMSASTPTIVVGELPPPLSGKVFVPPNARVLGGTYTTSGATAVLTSPERADALIEQFRRELPKLGWTPFSPPTQASFMSWGFVDAPGKSSMSAGIGMGQMPGNMLTYCGPGSTLNIQIQSPGLTDSRVRVTLGDSNICAMLAQQQTELVRIRGGMDPYAAARPPVLTNPVNARDMGGCPPVDRMGGAGSTKLNTSMTIDDLFSFYGKQLADSGWTPLPTVTMVRDWSRTDSTGARHIVGLRIRAPSDAPICREIDLEMRSAVKR